MNKKGFTLVELITTFALSAIIIVLLLNIVNVIKNIYSKTNVKTELYINQSNLSNLLNSKINNDNLDNYNTCTDSQYCYVFNLIEGESIKLVITEKQIKFGSYVYNLNNDTKVSQPPFGDSYINEVQITSTSGFIVLKIPIDNKLYPNIDFGINLVYPYSYLVATS